MYVCNFCNAKMLLEIWLRIYEESWKLWADSKLIIVQAFSKAVPLYVKKNNYWVSAEINKGFGTRLINKNLNQFILYGGECLPSRKVFAWL